MRAQIDPPSIARSPSLLSTRRFAPGIAAVVAVALGLGISPGSAETTTAPHDAAQTNAETVEPGHGVLAPVGHIGDRCGTCARRHRVAGVRGPWRFGRGSTRRTVLGRAARVLAAGWGLLRPCRLRVREPDEAGRHRRQAGERASCPERRSRRGDRPPRRTDNHARQAVAVDLRARTRQLAGQAHRGQRQAGPDHPAAGRHVSHRLDLSRHRGRRLAGAGQQHQLRRQRRLSGAGRQDHPGHAEAPCRGASR